MREHEVPTHLQTEDKVLLGLTFPQIVAIAAVVGLAYGLWKQAAFLPDGAFRLGAAIAVGLLGLAMVAVRPGGRGLPIVILDLLRFALSPKRYEGEVTALLNPPVATPPKPKSQKKKGRRRLWRFRLKGLPFKCLSLLLAVMVILTSIAPSAALAAGPASGPDPQRLFIEAWRVRGNEAELTLRAATSLEVQVTTETHDRYRPFYTQGVLYRGEPREYTIPLTANHKAIVISWRDALGNAGIRVLDQGSLPYPLPGLETADCGLSMTEVSWRLGNVTGRLSSACNSRAEEVVEATVLTDPADPAAAVSRKLLLDADVADVTGEVYLAVSAAGSTTGLVFARDGDMPFNFSLPQEDRVHQVSLRADITSTRVIPLPGRVDLTHNEEQSLIERIPVIGHFAGFYHTVSSTLSAWFGPVVHTVSATLSAWFSPVVRTLSATLSAAWGAVTHTVGGWISATVGKWLSAIVSAEVWTMLGAVLSGTVGKWLSAVVNAEVWTVLGAVLSGTVGTWLSAIVGATVWTTVGSWLSTAVGSWVSTTVGSWVSSIVGVTVWATVGSWVSTLVGGFTTAVSHWANIILGWLSFNIWVPQETASGYASGTASGYASGTATGYASGSATGYASGTASGYASGTAYGYASTEASSYASGTAYSYESEYVSGTASGTAYGYAEDEASTYASEYVSGTASGTATGYAEDEASTYATTEITLPAQTDQTTVSETVTIPGQTQSQTVSETVTLPGQSQSQHVSEDVWVEGKEVTQEVDVEVVIPAYTSAEVTEQEPLVRHYRDVLSTAFPILSDAPFEALPDPPEDSDIPSEPEQYLQLIEDQDDEDEDEDDSTNPYKDALDHMEDNNYFDLTPDEAAKLRTELYMAWLDSLSISIEARQLMEDEAGAVVSEKSYTAEEIPGEAIPAQEVFRELVGQELR